MRCCVAVPLLLLASCSTPYQTGGFTGGVQAQQMTSNVFRVQARGNAFTSSATIQDHVMLRAAETTKQNGGTHFVLISAADASSAGRIVTPGTAQTTIAGNTAYTTYSPAQAHTFIKPGQDAYIRIFRSGDHIPPDATSADETIKFVGERVKRG